MKIEFTCNDCGSGIEVHPALEATSVKCDVCSHIQDVKFTENHVKGILKECPACERKDFNRKIGVVLFVIAAILSIWTYGISFIVLYAFDFFLFRKLSQVVICYKCLTNFREVQNVTDIAGFNHEMNDRIVYSDHDFEGKTLEH
jgi:hypothetical protein